MSLRREFSSDWVSAKKARIGKHQKLAARYPKHGALQKLTQFIEWPFW